MRVRLEQLAAHLRNALAPVYMLSADEPLQLEEGLDEIRAAARARGFEERVVLRAEPGFEWEELAAHGASLSLFADKRLLDLRMPSGKPSQSGARVLAEYGANPSPDHVLLISTGKLDARVKGSAWYRALDKIGVMIDIWPIDRRRLPSWVSERAARRGFGLSREAAALLAERNEGNLLACAQEIEKLALLHGAATLDLDDILASVADSARFDAFVLVDALLEGDARRAVRVVRGLREEGVSPIQVLGPLTWALRSVAGLAHARAAGGSLPTLLAEPRHRMWRSRKEYVARALDRHAVTQWAELLARASGIDRLIKGATSRTEAGLKQVPRDPWNELCALVLAACGVAIEPARSDH